MLDLGLAVALVAMLCFTASDTISKSVSAKIGNKRTATVMFSASVLPLLVGGYFFGLGEISAVAVVLSFASGIVYGIAYLLLYKSLETEQVANTISLTGIEWALIVLFSVFVLGESITALQLLCFIGIFAGTFLVTTEKGFEFNKGYVPAMLGFAASAVVYILLIYALKGSSGIILPTLINRIAAASMLIAFIRVSPETNKKFKSIKLLDNKNVLVKNTMMGLFTGGASLAFLSLAVLNFVAVGSVIVAIEPAIVILLGYLLYKERFVRHQIVGFAILLTSIIVLSA